MVVRIATLLALCLLAPSAAVAEHPIQHLEKPDAVISDSESIDDHEGEYEDIHDHEGEYEDIHDHRGVTGDIHDHEADYEDLDDHHADSETLYDKVVESERLHGSGHLPLTTDQRLEAARAKLRAARERHVRHQRRAAQIPAAAAADPEAPAASAVASARWEGWTHKIDMTRERIGVAKAVLDVWDENYAKMIQADYPRGDARQELLDSRELAGQHLEGERAKLPQLIEEARRAGVPPGVLELHTGSDPQ